MIIKIVLNHKFEDLISIDNLLLSLHYDLINNKYKHGGYQCFKINDPKPRIIHKAIVRDRLLHHAIYRILYPFFNKTFIADSFSCRNNKGTHKAINRFREYACIASKNNTKTSWVLKCDIQKFFASIDQNALMNILEQHISDKDIVNLLEKIIFSFKPNGLPLGNLTSQLFANIYLNKLDQFIKHKLKINYYIRYADDFIILSDNKIYLENKIPIIKEFLQNKLKLVLHPDKIFIRTLSSGVDFLGWKHFFDHRILRCKTKKRMMERIEKNPSIETLNSYLGLLKYGNSYIIKESIFNKNIF